MQIVRNSFASAVSFFFLKKKPKKQMKQQETFPTRARRTGRLARGSDLLAGLSTGLSKRKFCVCPGRGRGWVCQLLPADLQVCVPFSEGISRGLFQTKQWARLQVCSSVLGYTTVLQHESRQFPVALPVSALCVTDLYDVGARSVSSFLVSV